VPTLQYSPKPKIELSEALDYALKCMEEGSIAHAEGVPLNANKAAGSMRKVHKFHNHKGQEYVSIIHSFSPEESVKLGVEKINQYGADLVKKYFPNHQFVVGTHNDTGCLHNHIIINKVNSQTGKVIQNKDHLKPLRKLNDQLARSRDLTPIKKKVLTPEGVDAARLERTRQKIGNYSYIKDFKQKANLASSLSTNFNEYAAILDQFGIGVRVEKKNISYKYPTRKKNVRGKNIGDEFDRNGLIEIFSKNEQRLKSDSQFRGLVTRAFNTIGNEKGTNGRDSSNILLQSMLDKRSDGKNNKDFTSLPRRKSRFMYPADNELSNINFPLKELQKAQNQSIYDYCRRNKIGLTDNNDGKKVLKNRSYVEVYDTHWINTKNKTQGSIVELVSMHKNVSFLNAVADINNNPKVRLLAHRVGNKTLHYRSFFIPKNEQMPSKSAKKVLNDFFSKNGLNNSKIDSLMDNKQLLVHKSGSIFFFAKDDEKGAFEFFQDKDGDWQQKKHGKFSKSFFQSSTKNSKKAIVLTNPFDLISKDKSVSKSTSNFSGSVLGMMEKDEDILDNFLVENKNIQQVTFIQNKNKKNSKQLELFVTKIQSKYREHNIEINIATDAGNGKSKSRNDIDFH